MYKSRFNIINVYAVLLSIVLLFGLGYYCIAYSAELNPGKLTEKSPPFLVGLFLFPVATYLLYKILKNAMRVSIDSDSFSARSVLKKYNFRSSEIQSIELFSRIPQWSFFAGELSDGINIILKDNSTLFLYDKYFRERSQLKQVFKEFADKNKNDTTLIFQRETKKGDTAILNADTEKFGRYYWFLSAMFLLLAFLAGMCYMFNPIIKKELFGLMNSWLVIFS